MVIYLVIWDVTRNISVSRPPHSLGDSNVQLHRFAHPFGPFQRDPLQVDRQRPQAHQDRRQGDPWDLFERHRHRQGRQERPDLIWEGFWAIAP